MSSPGAEYFELWGGESGWRLDGRVVVVVNAQPLQVSYRIECDAGWNTRSVNVLTRSGTMVGTVQLTVDDEQRWWSGEDELRTLRGCVDVDLGITPSTNSLPIRRLGLGVGDAGELVAAWIRFPEMEIEPLAQVYTRLGERLYRYESGGGSFTADLEVDDLGLVVSYEGGWARVAVAFASPAPPEPHPDLPA